MDSETEKLLSLYLDGQLSDPDRKAFELRLENEPELRQAVELHRRAAAEWKRIPDLPEGFAARARARLDETHPESHAGRIWNRFWTLETAGLLAAAVIVVAVLFPFLRPDETGQVFPRKPAAEIPAAPSPRTALEDEGNAPEVGMLREKQSAPPPAADDRREIAAPVPEDAQRGGRDESAGDKGESSDDSRPSLSDEFIEGLPVVGRENVDSLGLKPGVPEEIEESEKTEAPSRERAAAPAGEKKRASEPLPGPKAEATPEREDSAMQAAAAPAESFPGETAGFAGKDTGLEIPFRVVPVPGTGVLGKREFVSLKNEADFDFLKRADLAGDSPQVGYRKMVVADHAREAALLGIDLDNEMGILIAARRQGDPPVRVEVAGVHRDDTRIRIRYREIPVPADDPAWHRLPDYQVVILPTSDLPIELRKTD